MIQPVQAEILPIFQNRVEHKQQRFEIFLPEFFTGKLRNFSGFKLPGDIEVREDVDAALFQAINQIIKFIHLFGGKFGRFSVFPRNHIGIVVMNTHGIVSVRGKFIGQLFSRGFVLKLRLPGEIHPEKPHRFAGPVFKFDFAVANHRTPVFSRRSVE